MEPQATDPLYVVKPEGDGWNVYYRGEWGIGHTFAIYAFAAAAASALNGVVAGDEAARLHNERIDRAGAAARKEA